MFGIFDFTREKYTFQFSDNVSFTMKSELEKLVSDFTEYKAAKVQVFSYNGKTFLIGAFNDAVVFITP